MELYLAILACFILLTIIVFRIGMVVAECYHPIRIICMFAIVCYDSAQPKGVIQHGRFVVALIQSYPRLMEIIRSAKEAGNE